MMREMMHMPELRGLPEALQAQIASIILKAQALTGYGSREVSRFEKKLPRVVALQRDIDVPELVVRYLNRLSDLLFMLARVANRRAGAGEVTW